MSSLNHSLSRTGAAGVSGAPAALIRAVCGVVHTMITESWETEPACPIVSHTRVIGDLGLRSLDVVMLIVAIESYFDRTGLPWEDLLVAGDRFVQDFTIEDVARFLAAEGVKP
jgi:acyl carrier protein